MKLPRTILVPTDLSENAEQAVDYATALAAKLDATVHVLNVITPAMTGAQYGYVVNPSLYETMLTSSRQALDKLVSTHASQASFGPPQLELGDAREVIVSVAEKLSADLIVMGTHGRRGFSRLVIGSVAEAVSRTAPCPVLLVREGAR